MKKSVLLFALAFAFLAYAAEKPKTGLLSSAYKIDSTEFIAKKHIMGGSTVSLLQAETSNLNIMIGDIYDMDG